MGIRHLNKYLREKCPDSIRVLNMADLEGKRIAVDISIYLYKYEGDNMLLENMYLMLSIFRHHNITPIFIFDGKPPPEKKELLLKRKEDKQEAQNEYDKLQKSLENNTQFDETEKQEIVATMDQLKKQFIHINKDKIESVKELIRAYGATYYDAPGEADELCALLVLKKKVWACLSEDMDLFVYGCSRVLRYFSLMNHSVVLYHMKGILDELSLNQKEFREICILSGTDYNINANTNANAGGKCENKHNSVNLNNTLKLFGKYKASNSPNSNSLSFYDWIVMNSEYITDIDLLNKINQMFDLSTDLRSNQLDVFNRIKIINGPIIVESIQDIMREEGFIFIQSSH
jgi:5'-3' exonuclease